MPKESDKEGGGNASAVFLPIFQQRLEKNISKVKSIIAEEGRSGTHKYILRYALQEAKSLKLLIKELKPEDAAKTIADLKQEIETLKEIKRDIK